MSKNVYNVLWTGGLDSSYTMMLFSKEDIIVQPYHIKSGRRSESLELRAIQSVLKDILEKKDTRAEIRPLIVLDQSDIPENKEITEAYRRLNEKNGIGIQYEWLGRFSASQGDQGFYYSSIRSRSSFSRAQKCIEDNGDIMEYETEDGIFTQRVDPEKSNRELNLVFGGLRFPKSYTLIKAQEVEEMKKLGFSKSIEKTWFCHQPILGKPCGFCHPCQEVIDNGLTWRMSKQALARFKSEKKGTPYILIRLSGFLTAPFERPSGGPEQNEVS
ncbi:MAG: hypothetical protein J6P05_00955 [Lachnospiraceae bacterium]|nr:hypothetical protein [Lachnospiraceae bacterium]